MALRVRFLIESERVISMLESVGLESLAQSCMR